MPTIKTHEKLHKTGLPQVPGLKQCLAEAKVSCSRTQCIASGEGPTSKPLISSQALSHCNFIFAFWKKIISAEFFSFLNISLVLVCEKYM